MDKFLSFCNLEQIPCLSHKRFSHFTKNDILYSFNISDIFIDREVMFSQACVILSKIGLTATSSLPFLLRHGRYASYWNAFLLELNIQNGCSDLGQGVWIHSLVNSGYGSSKPEETDAESGSVLNIALKIIETAECRMDE